MGRDAGDSVALHAALAAQPDGCRRDRHDPFNRRR